MPTTFLVVPQWQGVSSTRAMNLVDGAEAIAGDLPSTVTRRVEVPVEAGDALGTGVKRYSALRRVRERMDEAFAHANGPTVTVGGDCGIAASAVAASARTASGGLAVLWLDAHADLNTPDSSPSGAFSGMVLRAMTGEGVDGLTLDGDERIAPSRIVLGGVREFDPEEKDFVDEHGIASVPSSHLADAVDALRATGQTSVHIHIDLDVLDPAVLAGLAVPVPFGPSLEEVTALIRAVRADFSLAGASITGFVPASPAAAEDDLPTILRIIGALTGSPAGDLPSALPSAPIQE